MDWSGDNVFRYGDIQLMPTHNAIEPKQVVGTLMTQGRLRPFVLHTQTGEFKLDVYIKTEMSQTALPAVVKRNLERRVLSHANFPVQEIRIGEFFCHECKHWIEATRDQWSVGICLSCSMDRASGLSDYYSDK